AGELQHDELVAVDHLPAPLRADDLGQQVGVEGHQSLRYQLSLRADDLHRVARLERALHGTDACRQQALVAVRHGPARTLVDDDATPRGGSPCDPELASGLPGTAS